MFISLYNTSIGLLRLSYNNLSLQTLPLIYCRVTLDATYYKLLLFINKSQFGLLYNLGLFSCVICLLPLFHFTGFFDSIRS